MNPRHLTIAIAALGLAGCVAEAPSSGIQVRDSSGISIVDVPGSAVSRVESWRADSVLAGIGSVDGGGPEIFNGARAVLHMDDQLVVADAGSGELRWFTRSGEHLTTAGRPGEGPGEFTNLSWIGSRPDGAVVAWDSGLSRLTAFRDGARLSDFSLSSQAGFVTAVGLLPDGRLTVSQRPFFAGDAAQAGVQRDPVSVGVMSEEGSQLDSLLTVPGRALFLEPAGEGRWMQGIVPFGPETLLAVAGSSVIVGDNEDYEIRYIGTDGAHQHIVRMEMPGDPVGQEDLENELARRLDGLPPIDGVRAGVAALFERMPKAEVMPAFVALVGDRSGRVWVRRSLSEETWHVFDARGRPLARAELPLRFFLHDAFDDVLLGVERDDLGVERVVLRAVRRLQPG